jgi:DNA polymerase III subunit tau, C-terminal domain
VVSAGSYILSALALAAVGLSIGFSAYRVRQRLMPAWTGAPGRLIESIVALALLIWLGELLGTAQILYAWTLVTAAVLTAVLTRAFLPAGLVAAGDPPPPPVAKASSGVVPPTAPPAAETQSLDLEELKRIWPSVIDKLRETSPALAATFEDARPIAIADDGVEIGFPVDATFNKRKAEAPDKRELMANALESVLGQPLRLAYVLLDGESEPETEQAAADEIDHDAMVEKLKSEFDAEEVG